MPSNIASLPARLFACTMLGLVVLSVAYAQGGPPLNTDDPGTVENGKWEINVAWINNTFSHSSENELPHFDANRGISDRAHFKIEIPWVFEDENGERDNADGGGSVGVKYRFIDGTAGRPSISTYPQIGFELSPRSVRLGLSDSGTSILLPLQFEWDFARFNVNCDVGYVAEAGSSSGWIGGIAVGRNYRGTDLLAEVHGEGTWSPHATNWIAQIGVRRDLNARQTLLFAFGKSIAGSKSEHLDWTSYLGIQFHA